MLCITLYKLKFFYPMKHNLSLLLFFIGFLFTNPCLAQKKIQLEFNHDGRFLGPARNQILIKKDKKCPEIHAKIYTDREFWRGRVFDYLNNGFKTLGNLNDKKNIETFKAIFEIDSEGLQPLIDELGCNIEKVLDNYSHLFEEYEKEFYENKLQQLGLDLEKCDSIKVCYFPKPDSFIHPTLYLNNSFFDKVGSLTQKNKTEFNCKNDLNSCESPCEEGCKIPNYYKLDTSLEVPPNSVEFKFELRKKNNRYQNIVKWSNNLTFPKELADMLRNSENEYNEIEKRFKKHSKQATEILRKYETGMFDQNNARCVKLHEEIKAWEKNYGKDKYDNDYQYLKKIILAIQNQAKDWILKWLWLNNGIPTIDPFNGVFNATTIKLEALQMKLLTKEKQLALFEQVLSNQNLELEGLTASGMLTRINEFAELKAKIDSLKDLINDSSGGAQSIARHKQALAMHEKQLALFENIFSDHQLSLHDINDEILAYARISAEIESLKKKVSDAETANKRSKLLAESNKMADEFLYDGLLKTSPKWINARPTRLGYYMRHHDALDNFLIMNANPVNEINEKERLFVLVHNLTNDQKVETNFFIEQIKVDASAFEAEIETSLAEIEPGDEQKEMQIQLNTPCETMKEKADSLKAFSLYLEFLRTIPNIITVPLIGTEDKTPNYLTKEWKHELPIKFPVYANYTITSEKEDSMVTEWDGKYRINKLYHFRFKGGMIYSFLERDDFEIDDDNVVTRKTDRHGLDGTIGLQIFPFPNDIRNNRFRKIGRRTFFYLGVGLKDRVLENWLLGAGIEPWNGVAVLGGVHLGKTERLVNNLGVLTVEDDRWDNGFFMGLTIDFSVFKQLVSFGTIDNPFKP